MQNNNNDEDEDDVGRGNNSGNNNNDSISGELQRWKQRRLDDVVRGNNRGDNINNNNDNNNSDCISGELQRGKQRILNIATTARASRSQRVNDDDVTSYGDNNIGKNTNSMGQAQYMDSNSRTLNHNHIEEGTTTNSSTEPLPSVPSLPPLVTLITPPAPPPRFETPPTPLPPSSNLNRGGRFVRPGAVAVRGINANAATSNTSYDDDDDGIITDSGVAIAQPTRLMEPISAVVVFESDEEDDEQNTNINIGGDDSLVNENIGYGDDDGDIERPQEQQSRYQQQNNAASQAHRSSDSAVVVATAKRITNRSIIRLIGYMILLFVIISVIAVTIGVLVNPSKPISDDSNVNISIDDAENNTVDLQPQPSSPVVSSSSLWKFNHLGNPIETTSEELGQSIALSNDGSIISMASNYFHETLVYKYDMENNDWLQLGQNLRHRFFPADGEPFVNSRICTSLNANGTIMVMGGNALLDAISPDIVQVFLYNEDAGAASGRGVWLPLGQNLTSIAADEEDHYAHAVQLSDDGTLLAVSARTGGVTGSGEVHMYKYHTMLNSWISNGNIVAGEGVDYENFGYAISLSSDGHRIAIGSSNLTSGNGQVQVFEFQANGNGGNNLESGIWLQLGQPLVGFKNFIDYFPGPGGAGKTFKGDAHLHSTPIALSGNGQSLVVGASLSCDVDYVDTGCVRSYQLVTDTGMEEEGQHVWVQVGNDIYGDRSFDRFGHSVAISKDGQRIGIGAVGVPDGTGNRNHVGYARLFALEDTANDENEKQWVPLTDEKDEIRGFGYDEFGKAVSLSSDGSVFAISAPRRNNRVRTFGGVVEVFEGVPK